MLKFLGLFYLFLCHGNYLCLSEEVLPEVETFSGIVRGVWKTSLNGRKYAAFEGIAYAQPPIGSLRFEEPQPKVPWSGVWIANNTYVCPQVGLFLFDEQQQGNEDCLYLNVYVPAEFLDNPKKLDVLVIIHGGAFMLGSGSMMIESESQMDQDMVVVSINYRLGIFGFLSTEDEAIPGNNGMKDQVLALKWVNQNIKSFGGNPDSVTIAGLSAGGASVHLHYFSPLSRGLFKRGLAQSGTALAPWAIRKKPLESAKKLAVLVGCPDSPSKDLKECLKQRPALSLMKELKHFYGYDILPFAPFAPVIERGVFSPFLDEDPYLLLKEGRVLDVPLITSHTADDGLLPSALLWTELEKIDESWTEISPFLLDCNYTLPESKREELPRKVLDYYLGPGERINKDNFKKLTKMFTDRYFALPGELAAKMQVKVTKSPVYYYLFNYRESEHKAVNFYSKAPGIEGVGHGEDGSYFYGSKFATLNSEKDKRLKEVCQNMLYTFVSTGIPSFDGTDMWQPTGHLEMLYLNVAGPDDMELQKVKNFTPIDFWTSLGLLEFGNVRVKDEL